MLEKVLEINNTPKNNKNNKFNNQRKHYKVPNDKGKPIPFQAWVTG